MIIHKSKARPFSDFLANKNDFDGISEKIFNLKPEQAIEFFEEKGFAITWDWREQLALNHSQVFTVAKAMKMDVLKDIRSMLDEALNEGLSFRDFQKELKPRLQKKGWWGYKVVNGNKVELGSVRRLNIIYETNMQSSYMSGRWKGQSENKSDRPWLMYVNPNPDAPICKALVGQIRRVDDPFWNTRYPPNHYRCKSRVRALTDAQAKYRGIPPKKNTQPDESFKSNPGLDKWGPNKKDYPNDIWKVGQPITKGLK